MEFPILLSAQLREHLRSLRKTRGLTQAQLGHLLGVGQARVAEIELNPGVVSVDQLLRMLSALQTTLVLRDEVAPPAVTAQEPVPASLTIRPRKGSW
jgi:HTH-type transcriptional regulator / antitoxin HipB